MHTKRIRSAAVLVIALVGTILSTAGPAAAQGPPPPGSGSGSGSAGYLHPLAPSRILDTRSGVGAPAAVGPGRELTLQVTGRGGVPSGAGAVVLNVTVTKPTDSGYLTVYPAGTSRPTSSNLNFSPGQNVPNLVVAKVGTDGKVKIFNSSGTTHVIADVMGWFDDVFASFPNLPSGGARQQGLAPTRLLDTRTGSGAVGPGGEVELQVAGTKGIPGNASAVVLNVTAATPSSSGFVTVYPSGTSRPNASNLNFERGRTVPNLVIAKVGANGRVKLFNSSGSTHLIVDATSYFQPTTELLGGGEMNSLTPARVLDTRTGLGAPTAKVGPGRDISVKVTGAGGVLDMNVDSVVLNVTVTTPTASGFLTVHPSTSPRPTASNLNFTPGRTVPNLVVAKVGTDGRVKIFNSAGNSHVIADVVGWFNSSGGGVGGPPGSPFAANAGESASQIGSGAATDTNPDFAAEQAEFWAENDPMDALAESTPEPLLEGPDNPQDSTLKDAGSGEAATWESNPFQIWSQGYTYPNYDNRIGRLVYWIPAEGRWSNCTATMVARNLAVTAAHCVVNAGGNFTNLAFFAGLQGNVANGGIYTNITNTIRPTITSTGQAAYLNSAYGYSADYAFLQFGPTGNRYPGDQVGWLSMMVNPKLDWLKSYGYPSEGNYFQKYCTSPKSQNDAGCYLYETWGRYGGYQGYSGGWYEIGWGSDMSGGASGGPVFANDNGVMRIASVNSNGRPEVCDQWTNGQCTWRRHLLNMWGPYFNQTMLDIYFAYRAA